MRNSKYSGNFNGNGALKTVCLSNSKRARHGRDQIPVLLGDFFKIWLANGWCRVNIQKPILLKEQKLLSRYLKTDIMNALKVVHTCMSLMIHDFLTR